ncbi:CidA/LrgA family protein [Sphingobium chungbukense]|uniref:LrgA n=1 Tax=Sphingobium chungbukense TaxID=56193 RepID=A0A0M3AKM5_9SPHN|nr:CidA/LrgA family protein [Sphingobium chungbukense]KKW90395.1 hypothetical protein YP76_20615 [Sphingobium chungbukense]
MIPSFLILLGCELAGEAIRILLRLPIPGPVIGMVLLTAFLLRNGHSNDRSIVAPSSLDILSDRLIANMGLMFVPAGVGIIAETDLLRAQWLAILGGLVGSTVLSLAVTALFMHHAACRNAGHELPAPLAGPEGIQS